MNSAVPMKKWIIDYWSDGKNSVEAWFKQVEQAHLRSITKEIKMLEATGNELRMPHSKALGEGLFELRERRYGYRIYYGFHGKQIIIVLAAGDKKSQDRDIKIARKRLSNL
jgi:putative addiction module killer protein